MKKLFLLLSLSVMNIAAEPGTFTNAGSMCMNKAVFSARIIDNKPTGVIGGQVCEITASQELKNAGTIDCAGEAIIKCGKLTGRGLIKIGFGEIHVDKFEYTGTIEATGLCIVKLKEPLTDAQKNAVTIKGNVQFKVGE